jgi:hypothetical protein
VEPHRSDRRPLEWTGTGKEMFIGFLMVMAVLLPFFLFFQFLFPALIARGKMAAAGGIITMLFYIGPSSTFAGRLAPGSGRFAIACRAPLARHPRRQRRLVMMSFWALFFRKAAGTFGMGGLSAGFEVSTVEWLKFYAKLIGLAIVTLGLGTMMWGYLRWKFFTDRLALYGEIDLDALTQSTTAAPRDAEGFADAFDIGAI